MANKPKRQPDAARRAKLTIQRRTMCLMLLFGVVTFIALFAKAYDLTINRHEEMEERAFQQQTLSSTTSASRGSIYDRTGTVLAMSATADTVQLDPMAIQNRADELDQERAEKMVNGLAEGETLPMTGQEYKDLIATTLSEILEVDIDSIYAQMERTFSQYEIAKKRVDRTVGDQIRTFISENEIQGIYLLSDSKRYYSYSNLACHVLGFLDNDNHGAYGIEALYNDELEGSSGLSVTARDARGQELMFQYEQYYDAENGDSLVLTIDSTIQYYVERGLEEMVAKYGAKNGATGIVMDVNSGALLAIASNPSYDLNDPRTIYDPLLQEQLAAAVPKDAEGNDKPEEEWTEEESAAYNEVLGQLQLQQWRSKAVNDTYEPGSTAKILTLSMALEEGTVNLNSTFDCSGSLTVDGWRIGCSRRAGHGHQTLTEATGNSCNPAFMNIGFSVGTDTFYDYMEAFGLHSASGVDLQGEAVGTYADKDTFTNLDLATYSFGQNYTVTPVQLLAAQAACINGGYLYAPYVVEQVVDGDGNVLSQHDATPVRQVISEETSSTVRDILEYVVAEGTGKNGQVAGYRIGGKTGTADIRGTKDPVTNPLGDIVVSFLSFAPADDPQVIMLLTLDTPARDTGTYPSGGNMVAPTASSIMADILPYLGISPQYTEEDASAADATVPYVVGMSESEAAQRLSEYGFTSYRTVGDGETVTDQTPLGGAIVPTSAEIILYMGAEKSEELCMVPNLIGLTASQANQALTNAGLIMKTAGASGDDSGVRVISQSHGEGTQLEAGTVVTVQLGQSGSTAD